MPEIGTQTDPEGTATATAGTYYPLTKMNFLVTVDEITGSAAFNEVTGIESTVDVIEFRQGNSASLAPVKIPGLVKHGNITLKMGYIKDHQIKTWIKACVGEQRKQMPRHSVTIELIDIVNIASPTSVQTAPKAGELCWILKNAWVTKYVGSDLNASLSEVAIESIEIAYEELIIPA